MTEQTIYQWPNYYDWTSEGLDHDTTYYVEHAKRSGGPILELGCGTGRISLAIAREGIEVVGVDREPKMLDRAKQKAEAMGLSNLICWHEQDIAHLHLEQKFPLIIIPYRSFQHLTTETEQIATLQSIYQYLTDDGLFAFNVFVPDIAKLSTIDGIYTYRGTFSIPSSTEKIDVYDMIETDHFKQTMQVIRYFERFSASGESRERLRTQMKLRYIFPNELTHLLIGAGFHINKRYGDFFQGIFHSHSEEIIIEAVKI